LDAGGFELLRWAGLIVQCSPDCPAFYLLFSDPVQFFYGVAVIALFGFALFILCLILI
jgi:hypothetical protein